MDEVCDALVQLMMTLHLLNSAAMAEAGSTNPNDQVAQALAKKVKSGLNEVCLQTPMCVVMAIIAAQQTRSDVEESNPAGLPIADKDPTGYWQPGMKSIKENNRYDFIIKMDSKWSGRKTSITQVGRG